MSLHGPRTLLLEAREVPLGGVRAMSVRRTLPHRDVPTIGAWCFLDRFGPDEVRMRVEPHPHIGLQTVTWPLAGEIRHRDTLGSDVVLHRGQLDLMTAGRGIAHSEYSVGDGPIPLDALQFWVALPDGARDGAPGFEQHTRLPALTLPATDGPDAAAVVVLGTLAGVRSPATVHTPIVGAEIRLEPGARVSVPLASDWEHAVLVVEGDARVDAVEVPHGEMLFLGDSREDVEVTTTDGALLFLLGGEPFAQDLVMWWNFAARTHEEIVQAREDWESEGVAADDAVPDAAEPSVAVTRRFGPVVGHGPERIPAPPIPPVRLMPRRRRV
ncbi:redox-sensitive bicupin YhaK (pirin superfamily) [Microbacterium resistens]|uniref:Redox-sensitive bicupin YhaK (Pirin superfamily) n=1 Tax=Microbacterium resistens TaxID=156977 RepID=A0ABU1SA90_9MICO|nr:pirin family protein [Microbacterium resistens]MDR6866521.1 redox-sensitive bicupin YhaK (pirin superfamily) [Microbacterium resistens]